jgi:hypothetical protein
MKMYLDDLRTPKDEFDFVVRSYDEAITIIIKYGIPNFISFDHDLGVDEEGEILKSGYDLAKWIVDSDLDNRYKLAPTFSFKVHSQNPVGKQNIISLLESYLKYKNHLSKENKETLTLTKIERENILVLCAKKWIEYCGISKSYRTIYWDIALTILENSALFENYIKNFPYGEESLNYDISDCDVECYETIKNEEIKKLTKNDKDVFLKGYKLLISTFMYT